MKIINNYLEQDRTFNGIEIGDVFIDGGGDVCMKIANGGVNNSVILENGLIVNTSPNAIVIPVKATLTIEGDE